MGVVGGVQLALWGALELCWVPGSFLAHLGVVMLGLVWLAAVAVALIAVAVSGRRGPNYSPRTALIAAALLAAECAWLATTPGH